jgi:hypothetical protein
MVSLFIKKTRTSFENNDSRVEKTVEDYLFLKKHAGCIRLGAHCTPKMCLRPKVLGVIEKTA